MVQYVVAIERDDRAKLHRREYLYRSNLLHTVTSDGPSSGIGFAIVISTHVCPVSESMRNVCRAANPEVNMTNLGLLDLDTSGIPSTNIGSQAFPSSLVFTNLCTRPV